MLRSSRRLCRGGIRIPAPTVQDSGFRIQDPGFRARSSEIHRLRRCGGNDYKLAGHPALSTKTRRAFSPRIEIMRKPFLSPLLLLVSLVSPIDVYSFLAPAVVCGSCSRGGSRSSNSKRLIPGWRRSPSPTSASFSAVGTRSSRTASTQSDSGGDAGFPAIVVSFGLTEQERFAAEETVFVEGHLFPFGVRILDGSHEGGRTLREAISRLTVPGLACPHPLPHELVDPVADAQSPATATSSYSGTASTAGFMPNVLLVLQGPAHAAAAAADGNSPDWLTLSLMEALDACESIPPAIVSCVSPPLPTRSSSSPSESSSLSSPELPFDALLLDTPLVELWRREARRHFEENALSEPLKVHDTEWSPSAKDVKVAMNLELDGAWVASRSAAASEGRRWDTSKLVVLDGLVDEELCRDLLDLITEPEWATTTTPQTLPGQTSSSSSSSSSSSRSSSNAPAAVRKGPPPSKWERGLTDVDEEEDEGGGRGAGPGSWGLTEDAMEWLCRDGEHPAIVELHSRLCKLYPDFAISHMPEAVMGPSTARMVANAPVYGDRFSWHIDADPSAFPPSPWRDHFGTYTNREPGMPLFATLLIYLDSDWRREWDAETLFLDAPTGTGVFVRPKGGRAIMMDQDITHRISTPSQAAQRPRYSLVLKLIFFSREHGHYRPSSSSRITAGTATMSSDAPADSAAKPRGSLLPSGPSKSSPEPHLCISFLPSLEAGVSSDERCVGAPVRFGSASPSPRVEGSENVPPRATPPSPPLPMPSAPDDGSNGHRGVGGDGGADAGADGVDFGEVGVDGVDGGGEGGSGGIEEPPPPPSSPPLVDVRPVGVKGKGLFATGPITKGTPVAFYSGEILTADQLDDRYPGFDGSDYVMQLGPDRYLDARDPEKSSVARYANHSARPNLAVELRPVDAAATAAAFAAVGADGAASSGGASWASGQERVALAALRDIREGEELTFDYGEEYFDGDDDVGSVIEDGQDMQDLLGGVDWGSNALSM